MLFADATVIQVDTASLVTAAGVIAGGIATGMGVLGRIASTYLTARDEKVAALETRVGELVAAVSKDLAEVRASERLLTDKLVGALVVNAKENAANTAAVTRLTDTLAGRHLAAD